MKEGVWDGFVLYACTSGQYDVFFSKVLNLSQN